MNIKEIINNRDYEKGKYTNLNLKFFNRKEKFSPQ